MSALDPEKVLRAILSSQQAERCRRAQAFITTQGLQPETVAELVAKEVVQELLASSEGKGTAALSLGSSHFFVWKCGIFASKELSLLSGYWVLPIVMFGQLCKTVKILHNDGVNSKALWERMSHQEEVWDAGCASLCSSCFLLLPCRPVLFLFPSYLLTCVSLHDLAPRSEESIY